MLKIQHPTDYLKKEEVAKPIEEEQHTEQIKQFPKLKRYRRSDSPDYDDNDQTRLSEDLIRTVRGNDSEEEKVKKIKDLIDNGADVNFQDAHRGNNTPLHAAVRKKEHKVIKLLLEKGAEVDIKNNENKAPLELAKDQEIIDVLKEYYIGPSSPKRPRLSNSQAYSASSLKNTLHGNIYQLKLLMLFLKRGLDKGYSFRLATEMDAAEKFDDLVFQYERNEIDEIGKEKVWRFLQAKHKQDESGKITIGDLLTKAKKGDFNLEKYFISYLRVKMKQEFQNSNLEDFIICTNIDLDLEGSVQDKVRKLKKTSFGKNRGKEISFTVVDTNDDFLNIGSGTKYKLENSDDLALYLKDGDKVKKEIQGQSIDIDVEIKEFLEKLVFAVNQPNEIKLGEILEATISREFYAKFGYTGELSRDIYSRFEKEILDWMKEKEGRFLSKEEVEDFFKKAEQRVSTLDIIKKTVEKNLQISEQVLEETKVIGERTDELKEGQKEIKQILLDRQQGEKNPIWFDMREPVILFTGRKDELTELHNALQNKDGQAVISQMVSISGLGGIGKSELEIGRAHV